MKKRKPAPKPSRIKVTASDYTALTNLPVDKLLRLQTGLTTLVDQGATATGLASLIKSFKQSTDRADPDAYGRAISEGIDLDDVLVPTGPITIEALLSRVTTLISTARLLSKRSHAHAGLTSEPEQDEPRRSHLRKEPSSDHPSTHPPTSSRLRMVDTTETTTCGDSYAPCWFCCLLPRKVRRSHSATLGADEQAEDNRSSSERNRGASQPQEANGQRDPPLPRTPNRVGKPQRATAGD